jgi:hypothetical protein
VLAQHSVQIKLGPGYRAFEVFQYCLFEARPQAAFQLVKSIGAQGRDLQAPAPELCRVNQEQLRQRAEAEYCQQGVVTILLPGSEAAHVLGCEYDNVLLGGLDLRGVALFRIPSGVNVHTLDPALHNTAEPSESETDRQKLLDNLAELARAMAGVYLL